MKQSRLQAIVCKQYSKPANITRKHTHNIMSKHANNSNFPNKTIAGKQANKAHTNVNKHNTQVWLKRMPENAVPVGSAMLNGLG